MTKYLTNFPKTLLEGDRVKITLEAKVIADYDDGLSFVTESGDLLQPLLDEDRYISIEKLAPKLESHQWYYIYYGTPARYLVSYYVDGNFYSSTKTAEERVHQLVKPTAVVCKVPIPDTLL